MPTEFDVVNDDIIAVPADLVLLRYAKGFHGADKIVATNVVDAKRCSRAELDLKPNDHKIILTEGTLAADRVMFLGTPSLPDFDYMGMRRFAKLAIDILAPQNFKVGRLTTTIHGAGYGFDPQESLLDLVLGFQWGLAVHENFASALKEICFVERDARRAGLLAAALGQKKQAVLTRSATAPRLNEVIGCAGSTSISDREPTFSKSNNVQSGQKRHVFVAMPFSEDFQDVYEYGIYTPVRKCGLICEKTNETAYTGDILHRIRERIETAGLVVADMTGARPNVYLEVGYAWGKGVPVIFVARHGEQLHFDVSRHRCIYYKSIRQLGRDLDKLIRGIFKMDELPSE